MGPATATDQRDGSWTWMIRRDPSAGRVQSVRSGERMALRVAVFTGLAAIVMSSCSGDDASSAITTPDDTVVTSTGEPLSSTSSSTRPGSTTTSSTRTSSPDPSTSASDSSTSVPPTTLPREIGEVGEAVTTWQAAVTAAAGTGALDAVASPAVVEAFGAIERFIAEPLVFHTTASPQPGGGIAIEECLLTPVSETGALLLRGEVSNDGSRVETLDFEDAFTGCVPADTNEAVLTAYAEYSDAFVEFASPPNPDDPRLDQMVTGSYRDFLGELLTSLRDDGEEYRGDPRRRAFVVRYLGTDRALVGDCQSIPIDFGAYEIGTDRRTDGYPPVEIGQTDYVETTMVFVDRRWMVSEVAGEVNSPSDDVSSRAVTVVEPRR